VLYTASESMGTSGEPTLTSPVVVAVIRVGEPTPLLMVKFVELLIGSTEFVFSVLILDYLLLFLVVVLTVVRSI